MMDLEVEALDLNLRPILECWQAEENGDWEESTDIKGTWKDNVFLGTMESHDKSSSWKLVKVKGKWSEGEGEGEGRHRKEWSREGVWPHREP